MIIEATEINKMEAKANFTLEQEVNTSFTSHLIESKLDIKDEIRKENMVRIETVKLERVLLTSQTQLSHEEKIKKNILEILLQEFTGNKEFKLHPTDDKINKTEQKLVRVEETKFEYTKKYFQKSEIEFSTQAQIHTNRGQINIDLDLSFSQEFTKVFQTSISSKKVTFLDPLIINYESNLTSFDNISSSMRFEFDLNCDGINELIPGLKDGSGFLALDKDKNGTIDNGDELFGANSGDGFAELIKYDEDGNSWIDENDSIFSRLLIWEKNESEDNTLITLGQAGIGAIYLSSIDSSFTYARDVNETYAQLKQSSFFLKEDGQVGLVTGVDFAREEVV